MAVAAIRDNLDCFAEEFKNISLCGAKIIKAEFEACTFVSCDFSETFFSSCRFVECRFENCNLSLVKLTNTKMSDVTFNSCKMIGIDWTMGDYKSLLSADPLRFNESILNDSNFFGLTLEGLVMKECKAKEVDFRNCSLLRADFSGTDFKGALFDKTHLEYANFTDAQNTYIDIRTNYLKGAIFSRYEALFLLEIMGITLV
ncbi:MAG: pentapeptide repeat-containing protein [Sulfurimonas sp.]|nr:pentapeptide repeat-containing protein [Sulfurimonas sp.]MBU1217525.1 pentapeptide repeat-containing protein [bacterium]MBU1433791.1 pentapeptide repeat-containing protein [bacterium]MBU1503866.1 pentapeptide repeat-containing protein [bacterium]MBU3939094.1 pentapeptide repeat-containing protein [bacterium]